jgi:hypothetical protein
MADQIDSPKDTNKGSGFVGFALKRIAIAIILIAVVVWAFSLVPDALGPSGKPPEVKKTARLQEPNEVIKNQPHASTGMAGSGHAAGQGSVAAAADSGQSQSATGSKDTPGHTETVSATGGHTRTAAIPHAPSKPVARAAAAPTVHAEAHGSGSDGASKMPQAATKDSRPPKTEHDHAAPSTSPDTATTSPEHAPLPTGVLFVGAVIKPMEVELNERWWGWRPNDIVNLTDNVNSMQLGILEVTRRTAIQLSERISRTGTTDSFNRHLENAVNWLMVRPERYWFPSPESKYKESLKELNAYIEQLMKHQASFYTRADNIIPLLSSYEELLGSCDENLVKQKNEDGTSVSFFQADEYFYYAKGVASAMATILEAVHHDFTSTLQSRHGIELLHHAIESCQQAAGLDPLIITDGSLDGIFANHRANIAAPISHARFYIGQLIKTLST